MRPAPPLVPRLSTHMSKGPGSSWFGLLHDCPRGGRRHQGSDGVHVDRLILDGWCWDGSGAGSDWWKLNVIGVICLHERMRGAGGNFKHPDGLQESWRRTV